MANSLGRPRNKPSGGTDDQDASVKEIFDLQIKDIKKELEDYKAKIIEVLAIFIALFTFVSFEIQIFKSDISILAILGFTLIMLGALIFFVILLKNLLSQEKNILITSCAIILIVMGIGSIAWNEKLKKNSFDNYYDKSEIDQYFSEANKNFFDLKNCLKDNKWLNPKCF